MKKPDVFEAIMQALKSRYEGYCKAAADIRNESNDDETRQEGKYDTRSTEASYLADGQARQAQVVVDSIQEFENYRDLRFGAEDRIEVGALIELDILGKANWDHLGPSSGGLEVVVDGIEVTVVTPESPLGSKLKSQSSGATIEQPDGHIASVW